MPVLGLFFALLLGIGAELGAVLDPHTEPPAFDRHEYMIGRHRAEDEELRHYVTCLDTAITARMAYEPEYWMGASDIHEANDHADRRMRRAVINCRQTHVERQSKLFAPGPTEAP